MLLVILNGPPGCGKDHAGRVLRETVLSRLTNGPSDTFKFAAVLKERTHALYGRPDLSWGAFEDCKDVPNDLFLGLTPRQAYINVSEKYFKPVHGEDAFGKFLAMDTAFQAAEIAVITDGGFDAEAFPVLAVAGPENALLVRIRTPETLDHPLYEPFAGDSRFYYDLPGVPMIEIVNRRTAAFEVDVSDAVVHAWAEVQARRAAEDVVPGLTAC